MVPMRDIVTYTESLPMDHQDGVLLVQGCPSKGPLLTF